MIPKIFHFIWLGPNKPYLKGVQRKIKLYGSEFKYYFWTDNPELKVEGCEMRNIHQIDIPVISDTNTVVNNLDTLKSDLYRMRILWAYGGIYSDLDSISVNKLPEYLFNKDFVSCYEYSAVNEGNYSGAIIGFIMASPSSEALRNLMILRDTTPYYVSTVKLCLLLGDISNVTILSPEAFVPLKINEIPEVVNLNQLSSQCFEVHLYHGCNPKADYE